MARTKMESSDDMEGDAARITARRERLGMKKAELAREAKISRTTLGALEGGEGFQRSTLAKVERVLQRLEEEAGIDAPPLPDKDADLVTVEVQLQDGRIIRVVTKSSVNAERVAEQVVALLQRMPGQDHP